MDEIGIHEEKRKSTAEAASDYDVREVFGQRRNDGFPAQCLKYFTRTNKNSKIDISTSVQVQCSVDIEVSLVQVSNDKKRSRRRF